jgi:peptidylamidoglycolate lyase
LFCYSCGTLHAQALSFDILAKNPGYTRSAGSFFSLLHPPVDKLVGNPRRHNTSPPLCATTPRRGIGLLPQGSRDRSSIPAAASHLPYASTSSYERAVRNNSIAEAPMNIRSLSLLFLGLAVCSSVAAQSQRQPYAVVHGWPALPEGVVLGQVSGVAVDSHNRVFIFHRAEGSWATDHSKPIASATVLCFEGVSGTPCKAADGKPLAWGENRFLEPHGLRIDGDDNVWLTDRALQQVFKFTQDGKLLLTIGTERTAGVDVTHFNKPADISFAVDGSVYVADGYGNSRIAKFSREGKFLLDWGKKGTAPGEFDLPHSVAVDAEGRVYVADRNNSRIQVFDGAGKFVQEWKSAELGRPWSLTIGPDNLLYVVDGGDLKPYGLDRGQILKLDLNGKVLAKWSRFGNYDGQIYWGHDIAVGRDGAVYVGDVFHGMRVQKFIPVS